MSHDDTPSGQTQGYQHRTKRKTASVATTAFLITLPAAFRMPRTSVFFACCVLSVTFLPEAGWSPSGEFDLHSVVHI
jgi:hypothetical protein